VRLLLDTHVALWAIADSPRLSPRGRALIADPANEVVVSAVTLWEIAIKHALARRGPNAMPVSAAEALGYFDAAGYERLAISAAHALAVEELPALHADPFDRLLVAQALAEPLRLLTHDSQVAAYSDTIVRV
jgi:PIN domain nuclease of toxin-antitoxin system